MQLIARVSGKEYHVEILEDQRKPNLFLIHLDGKEIQVYAHCLAGGTVFLQRDNQNWSVDLEYDKNLASLETHVRARIGQMEMDMVIMDAHTHRIQQQIDKAHAHRPTKEMLRSPMPGKVLHVFVKEGERVALGQRLLVLDAMKMENELCAHQGGIVLQIHVKAGSLVEGGTPLLEVQSEI